MPNITITKNRSADLVYSVPIEAPMILLFVDIYAAGAEFNSDGTKYYLIAACGMISFGIAEDTATQNSNFFVRFGVSRTVVVDKNSMFLGENFRTATSLKLNMPLYLAKTTTL